MHVDAYTGYKKLENFGITLVECWAHTRRKFDEALKALTKSERVSAKAGVGLECCNKLFALEREYDKMELDHSKRCEARVLHSKPIAEAFFVWCEGMIAQTVPKSTFGMAVRYAANQRQWLMNFLLDGRLELSNNRAENSIRPFTVGRKNWLFSYSPKGAKASAVCYSIIETAQANGLVPFLYLNYLFKVLPNISKDEFCEHLPWSLTVQKMCKIPQNQ